MKDTTLSKFERAITKLIEQTQDGELTWTNISPDKYPILCRPYSVVLMLKKEGTILILYKLEERVVSSTTTDAIMKAIWKTDPEQLERSRAHLVIYDETSRTIIYRFPYTRLLEDLYKSATYSAAGVEKFINSILDDDESS